MLNEFSLEGKIAIVTGAGRGIGKGISIALADAGADVVVVARTEEQLKETCSEIKRRGRRCLPIAADMTITAQVEGMVNKTLVKFSRIDILVNNAGTFIMKTLVPLPDLKSYMTKLVPDLNTLTSDQDWDYQMNTNIRSVFLTCRAVGPYMIQQRSGNIINVSSVDVIKPYLYHAAYSASKAAVVNFTKHLALEWAKYNIHVNSVAPGYYRTALTEFAHADDEARKALIAGVPLRRIGEPRDIGLTVVFLASKASDYITGWMIPVDGGTNMV